MLCLSSHCRDTPFRAPRLLKLIAKCIQFSPSQTMDPLDILHPMLESAVGGFSTLRVCSGRLPGNYKISEGQTLGFLEAYCDAVNNDYAHLYFAERMSVKYPLTVNVNLWFDDYETVESCEIFLVKVIQMYQTAMNELLAPKPVSEDVYRLCVVLAADDPVMQNAKFGVVFRFSFPYCVVDLKYHKSKILPRVLQLCKDDNVTASLSQHPSTDWNQIIVVPTEFVPLYGSRALTTDPRLKLRFIVSSELDRNPQDV